MRKSVSVPRVEALLESAHVVCEELRRCRRGLLAAGLSDDSVPDLTFLRCFALLGDCARDELLRRLESSVGLLFSKGLLTSPDLSLVPTAVLRLFTTVAPLLEGILDIEQRLEAGIAAIRAGAWQGLGPSLGCPKAVHGQWGQTLLFNVPVSGARWALVRPDDLFARREILLRIDRNAVLSFDLPCDVGRVLVAVMDDIGNVTLQEISVDVLQE